MTIEDMVFYFIAGHGRGWAFSSNDLIKKFNRQQIDNTLSDLTQKNKIRRVARGIYDYPKYSELLKKELSPDIEQVAKAYARKNNWKIEISGESALNILEISTQIEAKYIYLCNSNSRTYTLFNGVTLEFKKTKIRDIGFKHKESSLLIQALKTLGKEHIDDNIITKMRKKIDPLMYEKILNDTASSTNWTFEIIKKICKRYNNE